MTLKKAHLIIQASEKNLILKQDYIRIEAATNYKEKDNSLDDIIEYLSAQAHLQDSVD